MANTLQIKRGAEASIPTLAAGELGFCTDTFAMYVGDGATNHQIALLTDVSSLAMWTETSAGDLLPDGASAQDLGSPAAEIANIYIGTGKAYFGSGQSATLGHDGQLILFNDTGYTQVRNTSASGIYIDQQNAAGTIWFRTGATPTNAFGIGSNQNATFYGSVYVRDDNYFVIGTGADLSMFHTGGNTAIRNDTGTFTLTNTSDGDFIINNVPTDSAAVTYLKIGETTERLGVLEANTEHLVQMQAGDTITGSGDYIRWAGPTYAQNMSWCNFDSAVNKQVKTEMYASTTNRYFKVEIDTVDCFHIDSDGDIQLKIDTHIPDNTHLYIGNADDAEIYWNSSIAHLMIQTLSGTAQESIGIQQLSTHASGGIDIYNYGGADFSIAQANATGNLLFKTGSAPTTALTIDSDQDATFAGTAYFAQDEYIYMGTSNELAISTSATYAYISAGGSSGMNMVTTGTVGMYFSAQNAAASIYFRTGVSPTTAMKVDSSQEITIYGSMAFPDEAELYFGTGKDATIAWTNSGTELNITTASTTDVEYISIENYSTHASASVAIYNYGQNSIWLINENATGSIKMMTGATPSMAMEIDENQTVNISEHYMINDVPSADHTSIGLLTQMTVDVNAFGQFATLFVASDGNLETADANNSTDFPVIGLAQASGTGTKYVLLRGFARDDTWAWTVGGVIYASETDGGMTQTAPTTSGATVQVLGVATHADRMYFNPSMDTILVA